MEPRLLLQRMLSWRRQPDGPSRAPSGRRQLRPCDPMRSHPLHGKRGSPSRDGGPMTPARRRNGWAVLAEDGRVHVLRHGKTDLVLLPTEADWLARELRSAARRFYDAE